jgi:hypothetical protein
MKLEEIMKLMEDADQKGTYAGTYFDNDTVEAIRAYVAENKIPKPVNMDKLHTTLLYSRKYLPNYEAAGRYDEPMIGTPLELVVWKTQGDGDKAPANCLVMKYDCPELVQRHKDLMREHGATFDYDEYTPHITLSYDIGDMDIGGMPDIKDAIVRVVVAEEYGEDLNLNLSWASGAHE